MLILYPEIKPYATHRLKVSDLHELYLEEVGNPDGIPVAFVHGGPGAGSEASSRRFFDPDIYRIVVFDQRGAGRSTPHAELEDNTTQTLVADMEAIRHFLSIDKWVLFGGSWGSTLSLVYAQTHPEYVMGLILRGIFLCRDEDLQWFYQSGASRLFPDYWEDYYEHIPVAERDNMIAAYYKRLTGQDEIARMGAAKNWSLWEGRCLTLRPNTQVVERFSDPHLAMSLARIEAHYFMNQAFMKENQILNNVHKLHGIPGIIVHGRYDVVCPLDNATALHKLWPDSELLIVRDAGHAAMEPGITDALIRATGEMAKLFRPEHVS
ncbi:MAG: prolyl aminopeptidase [Gammaproteobacteria bacterium]|nr:prolyl aminopeptidase [Gammaproteobacteria bacterium]MDP2139910.1 prolyl aminopeptidase [Gammaproteobacteria bacterium]MDP2347730.1 prolyl aminopeptidase [Gammaproteobacteria bacterium]